ncbi:MAG TPA: hypothetical protein VD883_01645 [Candidatus Omnitrophota bacterium]|nr:hypothetical protein [Candidatus Omnitrophota bacterium]
MPHAIVLGDPEFFRIKSGKNPYTRTRWGFRKKVDIARAVFQWTRFKETLEKLGARVWVLPPDKDNPSMVFPANAGFLYPKYDRLPWAQKTFYLSNLTAHRKNETSAHEKFFGRLGFQIGRLPLPFEGEADFFPAGGAHIFSYGDIVPTGFRPALAWPPYRYRFSHRSDRRNLPALQRIVSPKPVIEVRLIDEKYYHGDTALFAFGKEREYLFAHLPAMDADSRARLQAYFGSRLFPLSKKDTENFAANSFQLDTPEGPYLVMPEGISDGLKETVRGLGFPYTLADVSEFFTKGGGSIKCLLCDLGPFEN